MSGVSKVRVILLAVAAMAVSALAAPAANAAPPGCTKTPILFVHGIEGSGAQFESQVMRFMSNGYEAGCFDQVDYNSTRAVGDKSEVDQQIDEAIAGLKASTGKPQVDVAAHSLGTSVMFDYLTDDAAGAERRANVAHYINIDGQSENPGVPTLAVWAGRGTPGRNMEGAQNVTIPNQTHVQACTSAESFRAYYEFLNGSPPANDIVPQSGAIEIAGKALDFPINRGLMGATVEIWNIDGAGQRTADEPLASLPITDGSQGGGAWGPVTVQAGSRYEFAVLRPGIATIHYYYEPFVRSDYTLRLPSSTVFETYSGYRPGAVSSVNIRYKEFWGDQSAESDELTIDGLNVCTAGLCPASKQVNAFFAFDRNRDGRTDLSTSDPVIGALPFLQGADVFVPSGSPADGMTSFQLRSRGAGPVRTLNTPNWDSMTDGIVIQWNDFDQPVAGVAGGPGDGGSPGGGPAGGGKPHPKPCRKQRQAKGKGHAAKKRCGKKQKR